jgi:type I restriction enzyme M protein
MEFTLKERRMKRSDLDEFVRSYNPENRNQRKALWNEKKNPEGRFRVFKYEELVARDKCSLDIFWLKDESLEDSARLPWIDASTPSCGRGEQPSRAVAAVPGFPTGLPAA